MNIEPTIIGYWAGHRNVGIQAPITYTPDYVSMISLASGFLDQNNSISTKLLEWNFTGDQLRNWTRIVQKKGQLVTMLLQQSEKYPWSGVDIGELAMNVNKIVMQQWGLDGIVVDCEGASIDCIAKLIPELRRQLGKNPLISMTVYTGSETEKKVIEAASDSINYLQTMAYWDTLDQITSQAEWYAKLVGKERVFVGVKSGFTPLTETNAISEWVAKNHYGGVMLWSLEMDNPTFNDHSNEPTFAWANAIKKGISESSEKSAA